MTSDLNSNKRPAVPDDLRAALQQEAPGEAASLTEVWHLLGTEDPDATDSHSTQADWNALERRIQTTSRRAPDRKARASRSRRAPARWVTAGLALVVLLLIGGGVALQPTVVTAPVAEQRTHTLPDGSIVHLNSASELSYPSALSRWLAPAQARQVTLSGEAFFDVVSRPVQFQVTTSEARITVLGTQFNVHARNTGTRVALTEGSVALAARTRPDAVVTLVPGETASVLTADATPELPVATGTERAVAWRQGGFAVTRLPLVEVFQEVERRYGVNLSVQPSAISAGSGSLNLYYPDPVTLETLLDDLCTASGLQYRRTSRGYEIF